VSLIERGKRDPPYSRVVTISQELGVRLGDLVDEQRG
jgi:hypothetical protein